MATISKDEFNKIIGNNIKKRRMQLGMNQSELAEKIGYKTRASISRLETGGFSLSQEKLIQIANALHTTPTKLLDWKDDEEIEEIIDQIKARPSLKALLSVANTATDDDLQKMQKILGALKNDTD